jgi:hypothetical protein
VPTAAWTRVVIALAAAAWALILFVGGSDLDAAWMRPLGVASSAVVLLLLAFDRWVWRCPLVRRVVRHPVLRGTWKTELRSTYDGRAGEVIEAYLVIRQSLSKLSAMMLFDRSQSLSMSADLVCDDDRWTLYYLFRSEKHALEPPDNPPARGAAHVTVARAPRLHLEGDYWMEHGTRGRIRTTGYVGTLFDTFDAAREAQYE